MAVNPAYVAASPFMTPKPSFTPVLPNPLSPPSPLPYRLGILRFNYLHPRRLWLTNSPVVLGTIPKRFKP
ncbi:MAG: hypothetical protein R2857_07765 [Vampirovibrionales bacterium]